MVHRADDLDDVEVALLGVLCLGLPPSRAAGDDTFRVDHVTAVVVSLVTEGHAEAFLAEDGLRVTTGFRQRLREAIAGLAAKEVVAHQPAGMPAAAGGFEAGLLVDLVNPDEQPAVLDRWLAQQCMERLLNQPLVYPYLMGRYVKAGEFWQTAREAGYQA